MHRTAVTAALAALAAGTALTACSASPAASTGQAAATEPAPATRPAASAPPCKQQYDQWRHGPARPAGKQLTAALQAVKAAAGTEDLPAMTTALKTASAAAATLGSFPMPACADPHGYWKALLARIRAAGDNAGSASGLSALILAEAPLKDVPGLEAKLSAELKQTTR